jgi:hypothetical protein
VGWGRVEVDLSPAAASSGLDLPCWQRSKSECSRQPNYSLSLSDSRPLENAVFSLSFCPLTVIQYTQFGDPTDASLFRDRADTRQCTHAHSVSVLSQWHDFSIRFNSELWLSQKALSCPKLSIRESVTLSGLLQRQRFRFAFRRCSVRILAWSPAIPSRNSRHFP